MMRSLSDNAAVLGAVADIVDRPTDDGTTLALLAVVDGTVAVEWYGTSPDTPFGPGAPVDASTTLISWSMAKSITHALVGCAVVDGLVDLDRPLGLPEWADDDRAVITLDHLLQMRSGLTFVEDYVDGEASDCIEMLFGGDEHSGAIDMGGFAASKLPIAAPGATFNYSSGTTNIISRYLGDVLAGGDVATVGANHRRLMTEHFARERLFEPLGMTSASMRFDSSGTFIGSSFVYATAEDFARFGELYRHDGLAPSGERLLPKGWRDLARVPISHDPDGAGPQGFDYGRHWWMWPDLPGSLAAHGYQGQFIVVLPDEGVTVVHLGITDVSVAPALVGGLGALIRTLVNL